MNPDLLLELLNGSAFTPELLCLAVLANYLAREARDRGLRWYDWGHLPLNMDLILAVFICDFGLFVRTAITVAWRFFGMGDFNAAQVAGLVGGGIFITLGFLCKIRALTRPDYGNRPWIISAILSASTTLAIGILGAMF